MNIQKNDKSIDNWCHPELNDALFPQMITFLDIKSYGRAKSVCRFWDHAFNKELKKFYLFFTPLFTRFIQGLAEIDLSTSPKFELSKWRQKVRISQSRYERLMIMEAANRALTHYTNQSCSDLKGSQRNDRRLLVQQATAVCIFYDIPPLPTILCIGESTMAFSKEQTLYLGMSTVELLKWIAHIKQDKTLFQAFRDVASLINKYKLLPVEDGDLSLSTVKGIIPRYSFHKMMLIGVILLDIIVTAAINYYPSLKPLFIEKMDNILILLRLFIYTIKFNAIHNIYPTVKEYIIITGFFFLLTSFLL